MREKCMRSVYTVNSSPYAVEFYEKRGFEKVSEEQLKDGIRFTPMKQEIKLL
jgi:predicted GNAT family N-acyltransferase